MGLSGSTTEEKIWNFLKSKGLNSFAIAGLMGNLYAESGLNPKNLQNSYEKKLGYTDETYTAAVDCGKYTKFAKDAAGYGLAQWTYHTRKAALLAYARSMGKSVGDLETQLGFLMKELTGNYAGVLSELKKASSVLAASNTVLMKFERPADQSESVQKKRAGYGQTYFDKFNAGGNKNMAKKVFLGVGHGGSDPGAVGYIKEADVNLTMALACRDYLQANGVDVKMSRTRDENDPLTEEINECNAYNPDVAVDIHNNAGGGDGFEAYYHYKGGISKTLAANIEAEVKAIGQNSRGLKTKLNSSGNDYFGFIRCINAPSIICEGVFVDNSADAAQADTAAEQKAFGIAYAKGILKTLGVSDKKPDAPATPEKPAIPVTPDSEFALGEVVMFKGNKHYTSSNSTDGKNCKPGKAKITQKHNGKHPYHVVREGSDGGTVWGWVDVSDLEHITETKSERTYTVKDGDSLWAIAAKQLGDGSRYNEIKTMNGLTSNTIHAGDVLKLPTN